jgi:hypothetical protein
MCPSIPADELLNEHLRAEVYQVASLALRTASSIKERAQILLVARGVWKLEEALRKLLEGIYQDAERRLREHTPTESNPQALTQALNGLRTIASAVDGMYSTARASGLTNRRFVGAALNSVRLRADDILDLVESVEISLDPSGPESIFAKSLAELDAGNVFDLADIKA